MQASRCPQISCSRLLHRRGCSVSRLPFLCRRRSESDGSQQALLSARLRKKAPQALDAWIDDPVAQKIDPYQAFDNVWQVGIAWVSSWAVKTSDGWVLIDTIHEPYVDVLLENLGKVGIAHDDIKMVLMTHGHFDHVGGYNRLKPLLKNARFVMSERGWNEAFRYAKESKGTHREWTMLEEKDVVARDGEKLVCGDSEFTLLETPGHTWGTASYMYDVRRGDKSWKAVTVGGQGLNAIESSDQVRAYIKSMNRLCEDSLGSGLIKYKR